MFLADASFYRLIIIVLLFCSEPPLFPPSTVVSTVFSSPPFRQISPFFIAFPAPSSQSCQIAWFPPFSPAQTFLSPSIQNYPSSALYPKMSTLPFSIKNRPLFCPITIKNCPFFCPLSRVVLSYTLYSIQNCRFFSLQSRKK